MDRFETQYPLDARSKEIKEILAYVIKGQSCQLISVPGAGRSTVLRLLAYNDNIVSHHLKEKSAQYLFIYVNFAEIPGYETKELGKILFLSLLAALREKGEEKEPWTTLGKEIYAIFKEATSLNDPLVMFQFLKRAIQQCSNLPTGRQVVPVFLFDRFSEFAEKIQPDFFSQIKSLRSATNGKLALVFSTHRVLENLLPATHWGDLYELFVDNHIYCGMYDKIATDFRLEVLEKEYGKTLLPKTKEKLLELTGGHGKLMKLSAQIFLSTHPETAVEGSKKILRSAQNDNLMDVLLHHILIKNSLLEIWQSLTREERQALKEEKTSPTLADYQLPFPLLSEFTKRNIAEALVPKTIRFNESSNDIFFGDDPIVGLTAQEFRLLKYCIDNPNRVIERDEVINAVWSDTKTAEGVSDEALDQMIFRVRKKIEDEADNPKHLLTVKGRGFRFISS